MSAMTLATAKMSRTGPDARASAHTPSSASGRMTSWIQRGTTTGSGARGTSWVSGSSGGGASGLTQPSSPLRQYAQRMRLLFVGDVVGGIGRRTLAALLPGLREELELDFVVVNGENAAGGLGITPRTADEIFALGADAITLGNHTYRHRDVYGYLDEKPNILRSQPGHGSCVVERNGTRLGVLNLSGNVHLRAGRNAFAEADAAVRTLREGSDHVVVDMHAEVTSEKVAMGWHLDGRVTAVVGTHTHVPTADDRVLPGGTAYMSDVGMTGPRGGVIGVKKEQAIESLVDQMPVRFETSDEDPWLMGVVITASQPGRADAIAPVRRPAQGVK